VKDATLAKLVSPPDSKEARLLLHAARPHETTWRTLDKVLERMVSLRMNDTPLVIYIRFHNN
jgi:hypothetical protein